MIKIIVIIFFLLVYIAYVSLQPLFAFTEIYLGDFNTISAALIGASGSIIGGIIGGIITGYVAFKVAFHQIKVTNTANQLAQKSKIDGYKSLVIKEISTNNNALRKLDEASDDDEISLCLKYALSTDIFDNIKTELNVDHFFADAVKYYLIIKRLKEDSSIHNEKSFVTINQEIQRLIEYEERIKLEFPTTTI